MEDAHLFGEIAMKCVGGRNLLEKSVEVACFNFVAKHMLLNFEIKFLRKIKHTNTF